MPACRIRMGGRPAGAVNADAQSASVSVLVPAAAPRVGPRAGIAQATGIARAAGSTTSVQITSGPSVLATTSSSIQATVTANQKCQAYIEWGTVNGGPYPNSTTAELSFLYGDAASPHVQTITGLSSGVTYHYRWVLTGADGQVSRSAQQSTATLGGGAYPATRTLTYVAPTAPAVPAVGVVTSEVTWGTHYVRIGNGGPYYPTHQAFSSTGLYVHNHYGGIVQNATTFATVSAISASEPHFAYCRNGSTAQEKWLFGMSGSSLGYYDVTTGAFTTIRDFSSTHSSVNFGRFEGHQSVDDRYFPMWGTLTNGHPAVSRYDRQTDTLKTLDLSGHGYPDAFHMSNSGDFAMSVWGGNGTSEGGGCVLYDCTGVALVRMRNVTDDGGNHGDFGYDASSNEIWVYTNNPAVTPGGANIRSFRADQSTATLDVGNLLPTYPGFAGTYQAQQGHVSCRNVDRPGYVYLSSGLYSTSNQGTGQVYTVPTDGSAASSAAGVEVFGFHRSMFNDLSTYYNQLPFAVPNHDGTKVFLGSTWHSNAGDGLSLTKYGFVFSR